MFWVKRSEISKLKTTNSFMKRKKICEAFLVFVFCCIFNLLNLIWPNIRNFSIFCLHITSKNCLAQHYSCSIALLENKTWWDFFFKFSCTNKMSSFWVILTSKNCCIEREWRAFLNLEELGEFIWLQQLWLRGISMWGIQSWKEKKQY